MASRDFFDDNLQRDDRPREARDECTRAALALTAFFDGEASEAETRLAQAHLEDCARCVWLWQTWTRTRFLLRHLPVPAVPPSLLTRLLLVVRLLPFTQRGSGALPTTPATPSPSADSFESHDGQAREAREARSLAEMLMLLGTSPFAPRHSQNQGTSRNASREALAQAPRELPPLDPALPAPPADLRERILRQTVSAVEPPVQPPVEPSVEPSAPIKHRAHRPRWIAKPLGAALVPSLAAWLFVLSRAPQPPVTQPPASLRASAPTPRVAVMHVVAARQPRTSTARFVLKPRVEETVRAVEATAPAPLRATDALPHKPVFLAALQRAIKSPMAVASRTESEPRESPVTPVMARPQMVQTAQPQTVQPAKPPVAKVTLAKLARRTPAISLARVTLRTRRAEWSAPAAPAPVERGATWNLATSLVTPPATHEAAQSDNETAEAAEIFTHVARLNDSRPDDVRDVVDEFRASLLASNPGDETLAGADGYSFQRSTISFQPQSPESEVSDSGLFGLWSLAFGLRTQNSKLILSHHCCNFCVTSPGAG